MLTASHVHTKGTLIPASQTTPALPRFVAYYRVSTDRQGRSGLGLDAQREAVAGQVQRAGGEIVADYTAIESGSAPIGPSCGQRSP